MNRHTIAYLSQRLSIEGARPKHRYGQNFLIDLNLIDLIVRSADVTANDVVLEVGTGTGSLTGHLAAQAGHVITVELDPLMQKIAADELQECSNVTLISADALATKHTINAEILSAIDREIAKLPDRQFKLVANLPYNIATPLIANLLLLPRPPAVMVVTIQFELAERILAAPATKAYGSLSVWIQAQAKCSLVRKLSPKVFWPPPNVDSAILRIELDESRRAKICDVAQFHEMINGLFTHRRKQLAGQLVANYGDRFSIDAVQQMLDDLTLPRDVRLESMDVETIVRLANRLAS